MIMDDDGHGFQAASEIDGDFGGPVQQHGERRHPEHIGAREDDVFRDIVSQEFPADGAG